MEIGFDQIKLGVQYLPSCLGVVDWAPNWAVGIIITCVLGRRRKGCTMIGGWPEGDTDVSNQVQIIHSLAMGEVGLVEVSKKSLVDSLMLNLCFRLGILFQLNFGGFGG